MICPYSNYCWRYAYSKYLFDVGYSVPPERLTLVLSGYAQMEMTENKPGKRLFAQHMPHVADGERRNICPAMHRASLAECYEYRKEARRLASLEAGRKHRHNIGNARVWLPRETRIAVFQRDRYKCQLCGACVNSYRGGKRLKFVVDHIIPLSRGGHPTALDNLQVLCYDCNDSKRAKVMEGSPCRRG